MQYPSWLRTFYTNNKQPNQPLYKCHATDEQYQELCTALRSIVALYGSTRSPRNYEFAGAYVLFGALWISRNYEEGPWSWDVIDKTIGANYNQEDHTQLVCRGAKYWNHETQIQHNGKRFIGYVMAQAGIPIKGLANEAGWAARCLKRLLSFLKRYPDSGDLLDSFIQAQLINDKPISFDDEHYRNLLKEGAVSLANAMKNLPSEPNDEDIRYSWEKLSDFPAAFRVPIESFKKLLKHYDAEGKPVETLFCADRYILWDSNLELKPVLIFEAKINTSKTSWPEIASIFPSLQSSSIQEQILEGASGVILADDRIFAKVRFLGDNSWHVTPAAVIHRSNAAAIFPLSLRVNIRQGISSTSAAPLGASSDFNLLEPAVFIPDTNHGRWSFYGCGNVSTPANRVLILCPSDTEICNDGAGISAEGRSLRTVADPIFEVNGRSFKLIKIEQNINLQIDGNVYSIRLHDAEGEKFSAWFSGEFLGITAEGLPIYRGIPKIISKAKLLQQTWKIGPRGKISSVPPRISTASICKATLYSNSKATKSLRALILPERSSRRITIGSRIKPGIIRFSNWGHLRVKTDCPTVKSRVEDETVILECLPIVSPDLLRSFNATFINPENGSVFSFHFEYPQRTAVARLGQQILKKDAEVTLDEVRHVVFSITDPQKSQSERLLMMDAISPPASLSDSKKCRLWVPFYIREEDHTGRLVYEDFRDELFRLMRLDTGIPRSVHLRLEGDSDQPFIRVVQFGESLQYISSEDAVLYRSSQFQKTEELVAEDAPSRNFRFLPLVPDKNKSESFVRGIRLGSKLDLHKLIPYRQIPWIALALDDDHCHIRPLVIPPKIDYNHFEAQPNTSKYEEVFTSSNKEANLPDSSSQNRVGDHLSKCLSNKAIDRIEFPLADIQSIWTGSEMSAEDHRLAEYFVRETIFNPSYDSRKVFEHLLEELGHRAFAFLPFWNALSEDVPLAFTFALSFDLTMPPAKDGRSLTFSVGRYHTWRWDLFSIKELGAILGNLQIFLRNRFIALGLSKECSGKLAWEQVLRILSMDIATFTPVLHNRLICTLAQIHESCFVHCSELYRLPFFRLTAQHIPSETSLLNALKEACDHFGPEIRLSETRSKAGSALEALTNFIETLNKHDPQGAQFTRRIFCGIKLSKVSSENYYMQAVLVIFFAWIRAYSLQRKGKPELLFHLAGKVLFFFTETLLAANFEWTEFCASFVDACNVKFQEELRNQSSKGIPQRPD